MSKELKPCPCGKTPTEVCVSGRYVSGNCCGEWEIEFRTGYAMLNDPQLQIDAKEAWNNAPRTPARQMIAEGLLNEVQKATKKFPLWPTDPLHAVAILNEEVGELNQAILQTIYEPEKSDKYDVRDEAIQAGAMLIRFMMSLDKYNYSCSIQHEQEVPKQSSEGEEG